MIKLIKNFFGKTAVGDFMLLLTAPVDEPKAASQPAEAKRINHERSFVDYIFGNIILGQKS